MRHVIFSAILLVCLRIAMAAPHSVCQLVAKEKGPVAFLLDPQGIISRGPIDVGKIGYKWQNTGHILVPTGYKMVLTPARLKVTNCREDCLVLKEMLPICKNTRTYGVDFVKADKSGPSDKSWLPWKLDDSTGIFLVEDPTSDYDITVHYKFDSRVVGELYDPMKQ
ncbi:hypothetical protein [Massilia eburnea]|uniref:hypothetical protein n=1 Tax=Massilia eburnea TaxID=1776165 RepID=UPI003D6BFD0F